MALVEVLVVFLNFVWQAVFWTSVVWLPVVLGLVLARLYLQYIQSKFIHHLPFVLLEIKIPREITKSPKAMELMLSGMYQTWDHDNLLIGGWIKGQIRAWFSLELASFGGEIHFYVWTQRFFKNVVEAQIYAQYPEVEITEVEDYTARVPYGLPGSDWKLWGVEWKLKKEDAYPIKTYVHYGLSEEEGVKEEQKVDPLTSTLEFLGSLQPREQVWIQVLVMASKKRFRKAGSWFGKEDWRDNAKSLIETLMKRDQAKAATLEEGGSLASLLLSPGERRVVEEVEKSLSKPGFDCGIRAIYLAPSDGYNHYNVPALLGVVKQYNSPSLNSFSVAERTSIEYAEVVDPTGYRLRRRKNRYFNSYRLRSYFYQPYKRPYPFVLNAEELATVYHFPGRVAATPTLAKIESKRAEPPVNLPL